MKPPSRIARFTKSSPGSCSIAASNAEASST
jgi:hypothetical protein